MISIACIFTHERAMLDIDCNPAPYPTGHIQNPMSYLECTLTVDLDRLEPIAGSETTGLTGASHANPVQHPRLG